jgi:hypothetical protein
VSVLWVAAGAVTATAGWVVLGAVLSNRADESPAMLSVAEQITAASAHVRAEAVARGADPDVAVARFTAAMCAHPSVPKDRWGK